MSEEDTEDVNGEMQQEMARMLMSVKDMGLYNLSVLASQGWLHLGLVPVPGTSETHKDLEQAKLAIDLLEANLKVMKPFLEEDTRRQFNQTLTDLQLNFVNKSKE